MKLIREAAFAAELDMTHEHLRYLRRRHKFAHVKFSRQDIRYTPEQMARIIHTLTVPAGVPDVGSGLTPRSAKAAARKPT